MRHDIRGEIHLPLFVVERPWRHRFWLRPRGAPSFGFGPWQLQLAGAIFSREHCRYRRGVGSFFIPQRRDRHAGVSTAVTLGYGDDVVPASGSVQVFLLPLKDSGPQSPPPCRFLFTKLTNRAQAVEPLRFTPVGGFSHSGPIVDTTEWWFSCIIRSSQTKRREGGPKTWGASQFFAASMAAFFCGHVFRRSAIARRAV